MKWPRHPVIYEINTWVWLNELTEKHHRPLTLATIPAEEWDALSNLGIDAVWLMGVWQRSPAGVAIALQNQPLLEDFRRTLPDFEPQDVVGSPYCIRRYVVDPRLGGTGGLALARQSLAERELKLILDFVPNHVAPDHPWTAEHPEYFIRGDETDLQRDPNAFFSADGNIFARGRDPFFPPWPDVLQLNAFNEGLRNAAIETLSCIAELADGVRCDMAMLVLNGIFAQTWNLRAGPEPAHDYWESVIPAVKKSARDFIFIAEAYWDLEWTLQQQGFDFCYDKRIYDRLRHDTPESVRSHLSGDPGYQERLVRFLENHDEPRAAEIFGKRNERAAAMLTMTLPGAKLLHEGQFEGLKKRLPVFLSRRPHEEIDRDLQTFYSKLLAVLDRDALRNGSWRLCEINGWPDNQTCQNLVGSAWTWGTKRYLFITNLSPTSSQGLVKAPWDDLDQQCELADLWSDESYSRDGNEMRRSGLFVELKPWAFHCFQLQPLRHRRSRHKTLRTPTKEGAPVLPEEVAVLATD